MESQRIVFIIFLYASIIISIHTRQYSIKPHTARRIAIEAYIYGYSLVTSEVTRIQMTNSTTGGQSTPMGEFYNARSYPPASYQGVVAPNADTLYSVAWVDLDVEPWFFSHPNMSDRYYLFPIYSLWTSELDDPGVRTAGSSAATYALIGPRWKLPLPKSVRQRVTKTIYSPTRYIIILGRTYCTGTTEDYEIVNELQDQYLLRPLSMFIRNENETYNASTSRINNRNPDPPFNQTGSVRTVISNMDISTYFNIMATRMKDNPPSIEDYRIVLQMARIGLIPGGTFDLSNFDSSVQTAIKQAPIIAFALIASYKKELGETVNGWIISSNNGSYGTDYIRRAAVSLYGWASNIDADAIYPYADVDSNNNSLSGSNQYVLHFDNDQTPPVNGFWSITMYGPGLFFVPNSLNKYTVSPRDALVYNADGSLDLFFQTTSPGTDLEANWLPAPDGNFSLMLRMYWPTVSVSDIVNAVWVIPPVQQVS